MKIVIRADDCTEVWDGIFYKKLSHFPNITDWELKTLVDFVNYEKMYGRECFFECSEENITRAIKAALAQPQRYSALKPPALLTECTACPVRKGCDTRFVCHTTSVENATKIFESGSLKSAVRERNLSASVLKKETRNAANDPKDYFEYVMFAWGNCQAGDRLVTERALKRFPTKEELSAPAFVPGVRFYFDYETLSRHPNAVQDGVLPVKVKNEVVLNDYVKAIIIPENHRASLEQLVPQNLRERTFYLTNDTADIWAWSEKVMCFVEKL